MARIALVTGGTRGIGAATARLLKESGYHIGKTAKVWSPGTLVDAPFGGQTHAFQKGGLRFNNFSEQVTQALKKNRTIEQAHQHAITRPALVAPGQDRDFDSCRGEHRRRVS